MAMYPIFNVSGSAPIAAIPSLTRSAIPTLDHAKAINYMARSLAPKNATAVPAPVGSAVLLAAEGMAQAILGTRLHH